MHWFGASKGLPVFMYALFVVVVVAVSIGLCIIFAPEFHCKMEVCSCCSSIAQAFQPMLFPRVVAMVLAVVCTAKPV